MTVPKNFQKKEIKKDEKPTAKVKFESEEVVNPVPKKAAPKKASKVKVTVTEPPQKKVVKKSKTKKD